MSMRMTPSPQEERAVAEAHARRWWIILVADLVASSSYHSMNKELNA